MYYFYQTISFKRMIRLDFNKQIMKTRICVKKI